VYHALESSTRSPSIKSGASSRGVTILISRATRVFLALACLAAGLAFAQEEQWSELGAQVYEANCSNCHQPEGQGIPMVFPPLAGHVPELHATGGEGYIARVVLFGINGRIEVDGAVYNRIMPGFAHLEDEEIAAVVNHVITAWGNEEALAQPFEPVGPAQIAELREEELSPTDVYAIRQDIGLSDAAVAEEDETEEAQLADVEAFFTAEQARTGAGEYRVHCSACHGTNLAGGAAPALRGGNLAQSWANANALYQYYSETMPPSNPGGLSETTYINILAHILNENGFPAGEQELEADPELLRQIQFDVLE